VSAPSASSQDKNAPEPACARERLGQAAVGIAPVYALAGLNALAFVWLYRFPPLLDYPDWLLQGGLLARALRGDRLSGYAVNPWPVPNAASTLVIGALAQVVDVEAAGKLLLSLYVVLWLVGSIYLIGSLAPAPAALPGPLGPGIPALAGVPALFVLNFSFFHGNVNFALGTALLFLALGLLIRHRDCLARVPIGPLALLAALIALSHGGSYFTLGLAIGVLAAARPSPAAFARLAVALAPSALLLLPYALRRASAGGAAITPAPSLSYLLKGKVASVPGYFAPFQGFYPFDDLDRGLLTIAAGLNVAVTVALLLLGALSVWRAARAPRRETGLIALLAAFALIYVVSPVAIGDFGSPGERLLYPALLLTLALGAGRPLWPRAGALLSLAIGALLALQALFWHLHGARVAAELARVHARLVALDLPAGYHVVREDVFDVGRPARAAKPFYLPVHEVLFRVPYYRALARGEHVPIFQTGLLTDLVPEPDLSTRSAVLATVQPGQAVVILGDDAGVAAIVGVLGSPFRPLLRERLVAVLQRS
jgi:hypothetical protein